MNEQLGGGGGMSVRNVTLIKRNFLLSAGSKWRGGGGFFYPLVPFFFLAGWPHARTIYVVYSVLILNKIVLIRQPDVPMIPASRVCAFLGF